MSKLTGLWFFLIVAVLVGRVTAARPNIVLIMADDLGYECIGANGGTSYKTPVLDAMAKRGLRFQHCYSQPICTPSRVKLMTGISNVRNYAEFGLLEESQTTFAHLLRDAGYATCIVGKWQLGSKDHLPNHFGFDEHCLWQLLRRPSRYASPGMEVNGEKRDYPGGFGPDVATEYAFDFIERHKDEPFLLYYPMILTHCPSEPTPDSADWEPKFKGSPTYKGDPKYFSDMVTYMDTLVGRFEDKLKEVGVRDNTLFIFTGDNGTDTPIVSMMGDRQVVGAKGKMQDAGNHVPLIVDWPGKTPRGKVLDDLVDFSDFLPTLCEATGTQIPDTLRLDGRSFLPQLKGQPGTPREWIYMWYARNGGVKGQSFTRNQRYKLYATGDFFDVRGDDLEKHPLALESLSAEQRRVRSDLQLALDQFADARPDEFANWKQNKKKAKKAAAN